MILKMQETGVFRADVETVWKDITTYDDLERINQPNIIQVVRVETVDDTHYTLHYKNKIQLQCTILEKTPCSVYHIEQRLYQVGNPNKRSWAKFTLAPTENDGTQLTLETRTQVHLMIWLMSKFSRGRHPDTFMTELRRRLGEMDDEKTQ